MKHLHFFYCLSFLVFFTSCISNSNQKQEKSQTIDRKLSSPTFNTDSCFYFVEKQVAFGPRIPGSQAHQNCGIFLESQLKKYLGNSYIQSAPITTWDGKSYTLKNIIASYKPENKNRILITAHWDARPVSDQDPSVQAPFDAANDGASGVGVILELARQISLKQPTIGIDFILWDLEDYGKSNDTDPNEPSWCLGSQYWRKNPHKKGYKAKFGINLDMVGGANAIFTQDNVSCSNAPEVVRKVWQTAQQIGYGNYFPEIKSGNIIDDHFWMNKAGIPSVDIIHFSDQSGFYEHWHTQNDNMQFIDKNSLDAVGQTLMEVIYTEK